MKVTATTNSGAKTLGALRSSGYRSESVKDEMRRNLRRKLAAGEALFPGVLGYDDSVVPQVVNAILSRHNLILLGLRGQAKSRLLRSLTTLLDAAVPVVAGCEIHDDPLAPLCRPLPRPRRGARRRHRGLAGSRRDQRYVEKLATPDVTIADIIGDVDPIRAARGGHDLGSELTMHYGLLPRAHRGIFALNELPDLAGAHPGGTVQHPPGGRRPDQGLPGAPAHRRRAWSFTANPEDYTARGKIITPLKDRIGSEIRTHYPAPSSRASRSRSRKRGPTARCELRVPRLHPRGGGGSGVRGAPREEDRQAQRRQPAAADLARSRTWSRTPSGAPWCTTRLRWCRASRTSTRRYPPSPASSSSSTRASWWAPRRWRATSSAQAIGEVFSVYLGAADLRPVIAYFEQGSSLKLESDAAVGRTAAALQRGARPAASASRSSARAKPTRRRCPPPRPSSSSRACAPRRRSAAATSAASRRPSARWRWRSTSSASSSCGG